MHLFVNITISILGHINNSEKFTIKNAVYTKNFTRMKDKEDILISIEDDSIRKFFSWYVEDGLIDTVSMDTDVDGIKDIRIKK